MPNADSENKVFRRTANFVT